MLACDVTHMQRALQLSLTWRGQMRCSKQFIPVWRKVHYPFAYGEPVLVGVTRNTPTNTCSSVVVPLEHVF